MNTGTTNNADDFEHSAGAGYLIGSVPLVVLGGLFLANTNEEPVFFGIGGMLCLLVAAYLLIVGAVARGIQVARRGRSA